MEIMIIKSISLVLWETFSFFFSFFCSWKETNTKKNNDPPRGKYEEVGREMHPVLMAVHWHSVAHLPLTILPVQPALLVI